MPIGYSTRGHGPIRVILLHGWLSDQAVFDQIKPLFDESVYSVAFMDFRSYGLSAHLTGDYSIDEIADDTLSVADALGWDRFHILGHSMGGQVMQKVAVKQPDRVISGIAVSPVPASGFEMDAATYSFFQSSAEDQSALAEIFNTLTGKRYANAVLSHLVSKTRDATSKAAYLGYLRAWVKTDFSADVGVVRAPILVIAGRHDGALGPAQMETTYLKQLPNVEIDVIEAAGHYPMLETPLELFSKVDAFFSQALG